MRLKIYPEKNTVGNAGWSSMLIVENFTKQTASDMLF